MAYQTGTSTGPNDLLDKLRLFLIAEGWNVNLWTTVGAGYRLHVDKVTSTSGVQMYFNFRSAISETGNTLITEDNSGGTNGTVTGIVINGSTGYDVGQDWDTQPGYSYDSTNDSFGSSMTQMSTSAIPAYYFFAVGDSVHVVVEVTAGKFQFMSFGCLLKQGTYDGGMYFTASWNTVDPYAQWYNGWYGPFYFTMRINNGQGGGVYLNVDSLARWRVVDTQSLREILFPCVAGQTANESYSTSGLASHFWKKSPNSYNNIAALCPIYVLGKRSDNNYSLLGWPEGVRFLNVTNYSAGQEVTYGSETWKMFHADGANWTPSNMYAGFAFKKEV